MVACLEELSDGSPRDRGFGLGRHRRSTGAGGVPPKGDRSPVEAATVRHRLFRAQGRPYIVPVRLLDAKVHPNDEPIEERVAVRIESVVRAARWARPARKRHDSSARDERRQGNRHDYNLREWDHGTTARTKGQV